MPIPTSWCNARRRLTPKYLIVRSTHDLFEVLERNMGKLSTRSRQPSRDRNICCRTPKYDTRGKGALNRHINVNRSPFRIHIIRMLRIRSTKIKLSTPCLRYQPFSLNLLNVRGICAMDAHWQLIGCKRWTIVSIIINEFTNLSTMALGQFNRGRISPVKEPLLMIFFNM